MLIHLINIENINYCYVFKLILRSSTTSASLTSPVQSNFFYEVQLLLHILTNSTQFDFFYLQCVHCHLKLKISQPFAVLNPPQDTFSVPIHLHFNILELFSGPAIRFFNPLSIFYPTQMNLYSVVFISENIDLYKFNLNDHKNHFKC